MVTAVASEHVVMPPQHQTSRAALSSAGGAGYLARLLAATLEWRPTVRISAAEAVALFLD
eukprot:SAG25_NODE_103_length_15482_cov_9.187415_13_plen_60_part_00